MLQNRQVPQQSGFCQDNHTQCVHYKKHCINHSCKTSVPMGTTALVSEAHCREACNLVPKPLRLYGGNILCHPLVGVKVQSQTAIVFLHEDTGSLLDCLCADTPLYTNTIQMRPASDCKFPAEAPPFATLKRNNAPLQEQDQVAPTSDSPCWAIASSVTHKAIRSVSEVLYCRSSGRLLPCSPTPS